MVTCFFSHLCPSYFIRYELTTYIIRRCIRQDACESDVRHGIEEMLRQRYWVGNRPYIRCQTSGDSLEKEGGYATSVAYPPFSSVCERAFSRCRGRCVPSHVYRDNPRIGLLLVARKAAY